MDKGRESEAQGHVYDACLAKVIRAELGLVFSKALCCRFKSRITHKLPIESAMTAKFSSARAAAPRGLVTSGATP